VSNKKLPADAPKIPRGWEYKGVDWDSKVPVRYACWSPNWDGKKWNKSKGDQKTHPRFGVHYITPIKRPAKKPALAKGKAVNAKVLARKAAKPVKARVGFIAASAKMDGSEDLFFAKTAGEVWTVEKLNRFFVLPADADSVARMTEQIAQVLAGTSGTNMSDAEVARTVLAAIGVSGGKGAK